MNDSCNSSNEALPLGIEYAGICIAEKNRSGGNSTLNANPVSDARTFILPLQSNNTFSSGMRREQLLNSLSTYNYMAPFKQARKARHGSTTTWLSETSEFQNWLNQAESSLFWCSGIRKSKREISTGSSILTIKPTRSRLRKNRTHVVLQCQ